MERLAPNRCPALGADAPRVVVYTDGGCRPNPGAGGWAAVLLCAGQELRLGGADPQTTNNRMELTAALRALEELRRPSVVTLVTDSEYVFRSMTDWITGWSKKGFRKRSELIPNAELWQKLSRAALRHQTSWAWTRGHAGDRYNEVCDELVGRMIAMIPRLPGPPSTSDASADGAEGAGAPLWRESAASTVRPTPPQAKPTTEIWLPA